MDNLTDPATFSAGHPAELYQWLQQNEPVYRQSEKDGPGYWAITRHEDVRQVGRDHETFSSEPTIMLSDSLGDSEDSLAALLGDHKMMLTSDPPYHTGLRRLISPEFTPRSARSLTERIDGLARQVVDEVIEAGSCELVSDLAGEMPSYLIADLMGLPLDDGRELYRLTETLHLSPEVVSHETQRKALQDMFGYAAEVYKTKSAESYVSNGATDLSTRIINAEVDGTSLDIVDFCLFFTLLIDAGGDTTRNLIAGGMLQLLNHPEQLQRLRANLDELLPNAVEEMLRHVSPVIYMRRTATEDTTICEQRIAAGDKVVMYYGAANRDASVFEDPDRFDIERSNASDHLAFGGGGPHYCLGANLARLEIEAMFREMLTRLDDLQLAGPTPHLESVFISGVASMPIRFTAGSRSASA